jgi:TDG/mug DNA glycosylase family protein
VLHQAGFTDRVLSPFEERELLKHGCGITNIVNKSTAAASDLSNEEMISGGKRLAAKIRRYRPTMVAVLGIGAFRVAFNKPKAMFGPQDEKIAGVPVWVLPNPSGLNASYQLADLARMFRRMRNAAQRAGEVHRDRR